MSRSYSPSSDPEKAFAGIDRSVPSKTYNQSEGVHHSPQDGEVHRNLKSRHLQMIALGGTIGTGLFVGVGGALAEAGPLGVTLGYLFMGMIVYAMMIALGEMTTLFPVSGAFTHYAARFVDPAMGFALGWNYWYSWAITIPVEIVAAQVCIQWWPGGANLSPAIFITVFWVAITATNALNVRVYGEAEFWLSIMKIVTVLGLMLLGIVITSGGGPTHEAIGFRYWRSPGAFQQEDGIGGSWGRFLAFWSVFVQAAFSYLGTEIVALTAAEAENPRKTVPKAIRRVFFRILFFYVISTFILGLLVSPNDDQLVNGEGVNASPWVIAIENAGIGGLPSLINVVVLLAAFSAGNSDLYASSRTLYGLAMDGKAPAVFRKCTRSGIPWVATAVTTLFGPLAFLSMGTSAGNVFDWLYNISAITGLIAWQVILFTYIRFYHGVKRQGIDRDSFPYRAPFQPYLSYFGFVFITLVILFNGYTVFLSGNWNTDDFIVGYVSLPIFVVFYGAWKLFKRTKFVSLDEMDFSTGRRELDEIMDAEEERAVVDNRWWMRVWNVVM